MGKKVRVGIVGTGRIGKLHARNLAWRIPETQVVAVSDLNVEAARALAEEIGVREVHDDPRPVLQHKDVDAVLICSSTDTHSRLVEEAAAAGKHIFCEKPIDFDLARIDRALKAVQKAGVKLQIGFNRRFDSNYRRVREAIQSEEIGRLHILHVVSRDPGPPPIEYVKVSGGIFLDMTIHDFDMVRFLTGSEATEIYTVGDVLVDPAIGAAGDIDTAVVTLRFRNGVIGTIDNSRRAVYGYDQRVEAFGSGGAIQTGNNYPNSAVVSTAKEIKRDLPLNFFLERYMDSFLEEMRHFARCILEDKTPLVTGIDGKIPVLMGLAAKKSLVEKRVVRLEEVTPA